MTGSATGSSRALEHGRRASGVQRNATNDHGLHQVDAVVEVVERPARTVLRVAVRLLQWSEDPNWARPNVAFRLQLGAAYGDVSRIYTVRCFDPSRGALSFDVVLHGRASPMMQWAAAVRVGDSLRLTGPHPHLTLPETRGRKVALFLDETAIPALYAILQAWPEAITGLGWVAVDDAAAFAELPATTGLELHRIDTRTAESDGPLAARARALTDPQRYVVWGASERQEMRIIRQHFQSLGLAREDVAIAGYWKRGVSNTEIDRHRRQHYERILAAGGTLAELDDLAIEI